MFQYIADTAVKVLARTYMLSKLSMGYVCVLCRGDSDTIRLFIICLKMHGKAETLHLYV